VPDRVHPGVQAMQAPGAESDLNSFFRQPPFQHLPPPNHPILQVGQRRQPAVVSARPQKPVLNKGFCGFGGHEPMVAGDDARVAR
jgi:hypothetical protein